MVADPGHLGGNVVPNFWQEILMRTCLKIVTEALSKKNILLLIYYAVLSTSTCFFPPLLTTLFGCLFDHHPTFFSFVGMCVVILALYASLPETLVMALFQALVEAS